MPNSRSEKVFAEFFAGIGLMRMGLEKRGWRAAFANDIDERKREMYAAHFGEEENHYDTTDVHQLSPERTPTVELATASFPCTDLSLAGGRKGLAGEHSSAFWGFRRVLEGLGGRRPPLVLLENVVGFMTSHGGRDFRAVLLSLNELGYAADAFIIDARRFVPQSRARLFVLGKHKDVFSSNIEANLAPVGECRPDSLAEFIFLNRDIRWNIRELPPLPCRDLDLCDVLDDLPDDAPQWWSRERAEHLYSQMSARHLAMADKMIADRCWSYGTVFRRVRKGRSMAELRKDGVAGCLRTPRGGSGRQILFRAGFGRYDVRLLTPRECARLMGADDFKVDASLNQALFGFGDAVCVPVIEWIAEHYLDVLVDEMSRAVAE